MAERYKKTLSRRNQERLNRALRSFDLAMLGVLIVTIVCEVLCYFRGKFTHSSPFQFADS